MDRATLKPFIYQVKNLSYNKKMIPSLKFMKNEFKDKQKVIVMTVETFNDFLDLARLEGKKE